MAEVPGGTNEGLYGVAPILFVGANDPRPAVQQFVKDFKARFGKDPNFAGQGGWTSSNVVLDGVQRAVRDLALHSFSAGMESIKDYQDIFGSPKMSFGPQKRQGSNESFLVQVRGGKWVPALEGAVSY